MNTKEKVSGVSLYKAEYLNAQVYWLFQNIAMDWLRWSEWVMARW